MHFYQPMLFYKVCNGIPEALVITYLSIPLSYLGKSLNKTPEVASGKKTTMKQILATKILIGFESIVVKKLMCCYLQAFLRS